MDLSYRSSAWAGEGIGRPGIGFLRCGGLVKSSPFKGADLLPCWEPLTLLGSFVSKSGNYRGTDSGFSWHFSTLVGAYLTQSCSLPPLRPFRIFSPSPTSSSLHPPHITSIMIDRSPPPPSPSPTPDPGFKRHTSSAASLDLGCTNNSLEWKYVLIKWTSFACAIVNWSVDPEYLSLS